MMIISFGALHLKTIKKVIQLSAKTMIIVLCCIIMATRMDPLGGYILGVLKHTTAWDRHWAGDKILK